MAREETLRKALRGRTSPRRALHIPARGGARVPLSPGLPLLCVERGPRAGPGREGYTEVDVVTSAMADTPPIPWHEVTNIGGTTVQFLNVEKKYQPASPVSQTVCPKGK